MNMKIKIVFFILAKPLAKCLINAIFIIFKKKCQVDDKKAVLYHHLTNYENQLCIIFLNSD